MPDTPPLSPTAPQTVRQVIVMGYHEAIIERDRSGSEERWNLVVTASFAGRGTITLESLAFDTLAQAKAAADTLLTSAQQVEDAIRAAWTSCYMTAAGRGDNPNQAGPQRVPPGT